MNRFTAKQIAENISNKELSDMLNSAKHHITDWTKRSSVNKSLTLGTSWNILAADFNINERYSDLTKTIMIMEFGEYLPKNIKPKEKIGKIFTPPTHQEPRF